MSDSPFRGSPSWRGRAPLRAVRVPGSVQRQLLRGRRVLGLFPGATVATVLIWTAVAGVSILWHELGHAFAARRLGSQPTIDLYSFGGLTHWQPRADATRWHLISVALAGPVAGLCSAGSLQLSPDCLAVSEPTTCASS